MRKWKTKGIILAESNMGDFDKMLTILTPGLGKISCAAKGARRTRSYLLGSTQFLCFGDYLLYGGNGTYTMNSCETIEMFYDLRTNLDKLQYAVHITKIIQDVTMENQNCYRILQLFLNTLYMITYKEKNLDFLLAIFKWRLLAILGYRPMVQRCVQCHTEENLQAFSMEEDGFLCKTCQNIDPSVIFISENVKQALQFVLSVEPKKIFSFDMPDEDQKAFNRLVTRYFNLKLEKEYKMEDLF